MKTFIPDKSKLHPPGSFEKQYRYMENDLKWYWQGKGDNLDFRKVEEVPCSLCGQNVTGTPLFMKYRFSYFRCPLCTLVYPSPRPKMRYLEEQYISGRFSNSFFKEIYLPSAKYRANTIFKERVKDIIMPRISKGRLLDIGCSSGHFLKVAYDYGFDVYGIEPNPEMTRFATEELKLPNILTGTLRGNEYSPDYFDVITLWDVLEHVKSPNEILHIAFRFLKPGGWIFAYTENVESFNVFITGSDSEIFNPNVHLRHYSPITFKMEFEKTGFLVRNVMTRGLDVQHIQTIVKLNPDKYHNKLRTIFKYSDELQHVINVCGKGDNLRLFAQKGMQL